MDTTHGLPPAVLDLSDPAGRSIHTLFGQSVVGMVHLRTDGTIVLANQAFADMLRTTADELAGTSLVALAAEEDVQRERTTMLRMIDGVLPHHAAEFVLERRDGGTVALQFGISALLDVDGTCTSLVCQVMDVSRLRRAEDFMSRRALFDPLTQLINRTLLIDLLGDQLRVRQNPFAVIAINLDRFKAVNDSLGQSTGDGVLVEIAGRLRQALQPGDAAARIAGDDFVLLCGNITSRAQVDALTQRVLDGIAEPIDVDGLRIQLTASAGISLVAPGTGQSGDEVLTQATQALKHAKERGRARWKVYDQEMRTASTDRLRIETSLRTALDEGLMRVAYQPLRDLRTGEITGAEALLRWHDPFLGPIDPPDFLPVAEETGMIVPLGQFAMSQAVRAVATWRDLTGLPLCVSVNLSPHELNRHGITERVSDALDVARLPSTALRFEITEGVLVHADQQVRRNITDLHALGIAIGIDDFGTGYASMSYLKTLPLDFVKIDRSFVAGIDSSREDQAIVRATLELAHALNLTTIAEGIESDRQLDLLTELGCDWGQGYLIGEPSTSTAMLERVSG
ncbi:putative bifunctional diguanylate cyclase/phosphodiesterase [Euzebya sp.]|uniref:putative bifunctional diguanylate cyclase/phosphodiesterase n=1 Tax=Euzebya sp. TaxID=1971409 RepID=UPI003518A63C